MKTIKQVVDVITNNRIDLESDSLEKIIYLAYQFGLEKGATGAAGKYKAVLRDQIDRASKCRYHKMAMQIQGNVKAVYDPNYGDLYLSTFGDDKTQIVMADYQEV